MGRIFLANAYLETGNTDQAIATLKQINVEEGEVFLKQYKAWYLGLSFLKSNQADLAEKQFKSLDIDGGIYREEAIKIIEAISNLN